MRAVGRCILDGAQHSWRAREAAGADGGGGGRPLDDGRAAARDCRVECGETAFVCTVYVQTQTMQRGASLQTRGRRSQSPAATRIGNYEQASAGEVGVR